MSKSDYKEIINLKVTEDDINLILTALLELPAKFSINLITRIDAQKSDLLSKKLTE